jgi:hypothetical protein
VHFDQEDTRNASDRNAAADAAAIAAQMEEDAYAAANVGGGDDAPPARRARSPVMGAPPQGGAVGVPPQSQWRAAMGWLAGVPGLSLLFGLVTGGGRFLLGFVSSLLWAPLAMLGLAPPTAPAPPPSVAAQQFEAWFEERHGTTHPPIFRGSCQAALGRSKSEAKFVLAYLHDSSSAECEAFCEAVLSSALFSAFVQESFVFWVGDTATAEGRAVRRALRVQQLPALVALAHGDMASGMGGTPRGEDAPVQALGTVAGERALEEESAIASLQAIVGAFEPMLVAARAEQNERIADRMMREAQEEEYARALAEDQAREAAEREAEEAVEREAAEAAAREAAAKEAEHAEAAAAEAKRASRIAKADSLPAEPPAGAEATRLVIKLPDGRRLDRRFEKECPLQAAIDLVESADPDIYDFDLVSNYPRKVRGPRAWHAREPARVRGLRA